MNRDLLTDLRPLVHPADVELRSALAALLQRLLTSPGEFFNPVYVGPLRDPELLAEVVQRAAAAAGLRMLSVNEVSGRDAAQAGVALLSERDAARIARYGGRPGGSVQVVIWGRQPAAGLTTLVQEWVQGGLEFDPEVDAGAHEPSPLAEAVHRLARPNASGPRAVIWVGLPGADDPMIAEVRLRWALETNATVPVLVVPAEEAEVRRTDRCVVLRLAGAAGSEGARQAWTQARELLRRGAAVFLATDPEGDAALRALGADGPGAEEAQWIWQAAVAREHNQVAWPSLDAMLIGRPEVSPRHEGTVEIALHETPLVEVLREAAGWQQAGTFVVYEPGRLGFIQISGGEIRGARRIQERQEAGTAAETVARVRDIARWPNARAFWIPREPGVDEEAWSTGCRLPLATVVFDLATGGRGSSSFASFEQPPGEIAAALASRGLMSEAMAVLRDPSRRGEMSPASHFLLGHFRAANAPTLAVESFRDAVRHLVGRGDGAAERAQALDAGLNALLLEVRSGLRLPGSAWRVVRTSGTDHPAALLDSAGRVRIVLELAARASERGAVERLARWLIDRGVDGDLPVRLLRQFALPSSSPPGLPEAEPVLLRAAGGAR